MDGELQPGTSTTEVKLSEIALRLGEISQNVLVVQQQLATLAETAAHRLDPPAAGETDPPQRQLHLSGRVAPRGSSNIVVIASTEIRIPDSSFSRLLFLTVRRQESREGFVDGNEFATTGRRAKRPSLEINAAYQAANRLRDLLRPFLGRDFVQVRARNVRLAPELQVTWDRERLLQHPKLEIRELAEQLPA